MVNRNFAWWKPVLCKNEKGNLVPVRWAGSIDRAYNGHLLNEILSMPTKSPISYDDAILIFFDRIQSTLKARDYGTKPGQSSWYIRNFVQYISDMGYHIELSGDEIEPIGAISEVRA